MNWKIMLLAAVTFVTVASLGVLAVATVTVMAAPMLDTTVQSAPAPVAVPVQEEARPQIIKNKPVFNEAGPEIRGRNQDPDHKNGGCKSKQKKTDKL